MTNKAEYLILADKSLIIEYYRGKFHVDELIDIKKKIGSDKEYNPSYNIIHDFREIEFLFEIDEVAKYVEVISKNEKFIGDRKSTMITATPNQVITSLGFEVLKNKLPIEVKVCSTLETAFTFVGLSINDWKTIESLMNKLKNTP